MMWLLAKLGLSVVDGQSLIPLIITVLVLATVVGGGFYTVHTLQAQGFAKASAICAANVQKQKDAVAELERQNAEISRSAAIAYAVSKSRQPTALAAAKQQVQNEAQTPASQTASASSPCSLSPDGLSIWNRPVSQPDTLGEYALQSGRLNPAGTSSFAANLAASSSTGFANPTDESGRLKSALRSAKDRIQRARAAVNAVPATANPASEKVTPP